VVGNTSGNLSNGLVWRCMVVAADLMIRYVYGAGK